MWHKFIISLPKAKETSKMKHKGDQKEIFAGSWETYAYTCTYRNIATRLESSEHKHKGYS